MLTPADWRDVVDVTVAVLLSEVIWTLLVLAVERARQALHRRRHG